MELSKAYNPKEHEDRIYKEWEDSGLFNPDTCIAQRHAAPDAPSFSLVLPPPNVTGTLHTGHAMTLSVEDLMVRYHRMKGERTLFLPGTDHAAIATQSRVEKTIFEQEGKTRYDLGRDELLRRVGAFAQESHDTIVNQCRKMGASLDWSREAYTFDEPRGRAVYAAFKKMYDDGLIYRAHRTVNWSVKGQSTHSDEEVEYVERDATLYTFKYSKDFPIEISTTRPETKLGDTAVAVHPGDARYKHLIGRTFTADVGAAAPLSIRIIGDESVDPGFGTGALGVTPAHSHIDYEMYQRHGLELIQVIGDDGRMTAAAGKDYAGLTVEEAREKFVAWLRRKGLLREETTIKQNVGVSQRFGDIIEVIPKLQWWVDVTKQFTIAESKIDGISSGQNVSLKELMLHVVRSGQVRIIPDRFEKIYFHWLENFQPWCISRQIWFGHRIPVWYRKSEQVNERSREQVEMRVGDVSPGAGWEQDPDTLDTWFSSGLWTFSTLGWPTFAETATAGKPGPENDLANYHPTSVLETGYDILFFWVARMILMTTYLRGEIPFKTVYMHGLVRDEQGRKMSKSLGNVIDPLDMIAQYGTDALRLAMVIGTTPGNDIKLSVEKIGGFKNFTNKLWNIARFALLSIPQPQMDPVRPAAQTLADRWILERFDMVVRDYTRQIESFNFSHAGEVLRDFTWTELADWYLEIAKVEGKKEALLNYLLVNVLKLWHPFMPFVTEAIWKEMFPGTFIMVQRLPESVGSGWWAEKIKSLFKTDTAIRQFSVLQEIVSAIRNLRAEQKIEPAKKVAAHIAAGAHADWLSQQTQIITSLARLETLTVAASGKPEQKSVLKVVAGMEVYLVVEGAVDAAAEKARLEKEAAQLTAYIGGLEKKLANQEYVQNAPAAVVAADRKRLADAQEKLQKIST